MSLSLKEIHRAIELGVSSSAHGSKGCRCLFHIPQAHWQLAAQCEFCCPWLGVLSGHEVCLAVDWVHS